jgi:hypothetical protein
MMTAVLTAGGVVAGRLFPPAFACGLNLYATVAALGLASRLGLTDALPVGLRGLEHGLVIGSALALYAVEFFIDKIRWVNSGWDALHTVIRPAAAALLATLALEAAPMELRIAGGAFAALVALGAHGLKAGLRIAINSRPGRLPCIAISILEDAAAVGLVLVSLLAPQLALVIGAGAALLLVVSAPSLFRPAALAILAVHARTRGIFGGGWRGREALPGRIRALVPPEDLGMAAPRVTRAAVLSGGTGTGRCRNGWLVLENGGAAFLYQDGLRRPKRLALARMRDASVSIGMLADTLEILGEDQQCTTLLLLKDGPPPHVTRTELLSAS